MKWLNTILLLTLSALILTYHVKYQSLLATHTALSTTLAPSPTRDLFRLTDSTPGVQCEGYLRSAPVTLLTITRGDNTKTPYLSIFNKEGAQLVVIDMETGRANLTPGKSNEAARQFWKAVEVNFPICNKKKS